jgi:hypothetical protein
MNPPVARQLVHSAHQPPAYERDGNQAEIVADLYERGEKAPEEQSFF